MDTELDKVDERVFSISSKQKGDITENRMAEIITLSSHGQLTSYRPNSDDDGVDLIVNPRAEFKPIFLQVKSRFVLQKNGTFIQNIGKNTFVSDASFFLLFVYFNHTSLEVDKVWLVPSTEFATLAYDKKEGKTYKSFYRFTANPRETSKDKWSVFSVDKAHLGNQLLRVIRDVYGK